MEITNIKKIITLFRSNSKDPLYSDIYDYLNHLSRLKCILIDKHKVISIYKLRSEINIINGSKILGYNELLDNILIYNGKKVIISNFITNCNDITIFISDDMNRVLGILSQKV